MVQLPSVRYILESHIAIALNGCGTHSCVTSHTQMHRSPTIWTVSLTSTQLICITVVFTKNRTVWTSLYGLFTPREPGSESEKDQRINEKRQNKIFAFMFAFAWSEHSLSHRSHQAMAEANVKIFFDVCRLLVELFYLFFHLFSCRFPLSLGMNRPLGIVHVHDSEKNWHRLQMGS